MKLRAVPSMAHHLDKSSAAQSLDVRDRLRGVCVSPVGAKLGPLCLARKWRTTAIGCAVFGWSTLPCVDLPLASGGAAHRGLHLSVVVSTIGAAVAAQFCVAVPLMRGQ